MAIWFVDKRPRKERVESGIQWTLRGGALNLYIVLTISNCMDLYLKEPEKDDCAVRKMKKLQLKSGRHSNTAEIDELLREFESYRKGRFPLDLEEIQDYIYKATEDRPYDRYIVYRFKKELVQKYSSI
jgi:hypothetical protein